MPLPHSGGRGSRRGSRRGSFCPWVSPRVRPPADLARVGHAVGHAVGLAVGQVKLRCRKGIPSSLRARAWQLLSDSKALLDRNPGLFQVRKKRERGPGAWPGVAPPQEGNALPRPQELERQPGEARWLDAIEKDLHRQFPFHEMFVARGGHG